jgi:hypothetical protein
VAKIRVPSAFLHHEQIFARNRADENFFGAVIYRRWRCGCGGAAGRGTYTQN